jgi:phage-related protein
LQVYTKKGIVAMAESDEAERPDPKPVFWVASSRKDLRKFPKAVRQTIGQALFDAQTGGKHPDAKPLKGFGGAGVLEIVEDDGGNTYRAVYTVRFAGVVYVLHAFQKKSKSGIKTPAGEIAKIRARLKEAEKHYAEWSRQQQQEGEGRPG